MAKRKTAAKKTGRGSASRRPSAAQRAVLKEVARRLEGTKSLRTGHIVFRLKGRGGGNYCLDCRERGVRVVGRAPRSGARPLIEVICPTDVFEEIAGSGADPVALFQSGRFRVRGDIKYMVKLGLELGLIKQPV